MATKKNEEAPAIEQVVAEKPKVDGESGKIKVKKKPKKKENIPTVTKVDMAKPTEEIVEEVIKVDLQPKVEEEVVSEPLKTTEVLEEITEDSIKVQVPVEPKLPEAVGKLVSFMEETGGSIDDYMKLNQDYSTYDDGDLLTSYYKETKPHLEEEDINFLVEDSFDWDEKYDDEKIVKRKKLALKEQVAQAKLHLESVKSKYYEDIKMGSKLNEEQQDALRFFNESKEKQEIHTQAQEAFLQRTDEVFNNEFKGFEYKVGDKRYRYNVNDADNVKGKQSDINNFVRKFLNEDNVMDDAKGYHKGLFTAMNSDAVANHFYEQGKADALKQSIVNSKNIDMGPRQSHSTEVQSGFKVKALNVDSNDFEFKIKRKK